jgi:hypothetical protein
LEGGITPFDLRFEGGGHVKKSPVPVDKDMFEIDVFAP